MENQNVQPLVVQLRFARSEFVRCLDGVSEEDGQKRVLPMNSISWMVGHVTNQEHWYWVRFPQGKNVAPGLSELVGFGLPATTPPLADMWETWHAVTAVADNFLNTLASADLQTHITYKGKQRPESIGTMLLRNIYHYWFHTGEAHAVRQQLGHTDLPQFVGGMETAVYRPE
ncbi:MAG: DinB family protein [Chloroflexi bacterium]|nr:MAG: DinB family protein [Chloroflexota bacterium]